MEVAIGFDRLWCVAKTGSNTSKSFTEIVPTLTYAVRFGNYINIRTYSITRIALTTSMEIIICFNFS